MRPGRIGFTTRASSMLAAGLTAVVCGALLGETDLLRAGVLAAAIPVVAAVVIHRYRIRIANRRTVEPHRAAAGESVTVHLTITNRSALPTGPLMLEDGLPDLAVGHARFVLDSLARHEARTVSYRLPALGRGRYRIGPLRIRLRDPFKMVEITRSFTATGEFLVTPVVEDLTAGEPLRSDDSGDGTGSHSIGAHGADDASTREYRIGDDLRKIHWRSSARTGVLMVRQEERPWRSQTTLLLDLRSDAHAAAPGDGTGGWDPRLTNSLEWAVSATASIGRHALRDGRELTLLGDPERPQRLRVASPDHLATQLAEVRPSRAADLGFLDTSLRAAAAESAVVAVLGRLDAATLRLLARAQQPGRTPGRALVLDVDSWRTDPAADAPDAPARGGRPGAEPTEADTAARVLADAGWRVLVVRRGMSAARVWQLLGAGGATGAGVAAAGAGVAP